jgi:hypothetical protein
MKIRTRAVFSRLRAGKTRSRTWDQPSAEAENCTGVRSPILQAFPKRCTVQEERLSLDTALVLVPGERRTDFLQMLPTAQQQGLLADTVEKMPNLPGLAGILAKMQMDGIVPENLNARPRPSYKDSADHSPDEWRQLREDVKAQIESVKSSRNGSGNGGA